jgi:hypothetical protein
MVGALAGLERACLVSDAHGARALDRGKFEQPLPLLARKKLPARTD